jgi:hypothetical protein
LRIFVVEEIGDEREMAGGILAEECGEDFGECVGVFIAEVRFETEGREGFGAWPCAQGDSGVLAGLFFGVGEEVDEDKQSVVRAREREAEGGESAEFCGGVDGSFHDGFVLGIASSGEVEVRDDGGGGVPVDEGVEGGGFAEAAGVALGLAGLDECGDVCDEFGSEGFGIDFLGEFGGGFEDDAVEVFGAEEFGEGGEGLGRGGGGAELAEEGEVGFGGGFGHGGIVRDESVSQRVDELTN